MKHISASWLARAAAAAALVTEDDVKARIRAQLDGTAGGKAALADRLGISTFNLSLLLRGRGQLTDAIAKRLGYRKVVRFERVE